MHLVASGRLDPGCCGIRHDFVGEGSDEGRLEVGVEPREAVAGEAGVGRQGAVKVTVVVSEEENERLQLVVYR